jgi:hypothetical protein
LILFGHKTIEVRSRRTHLRERVHIYAGLNRIEPQEEARIAQEYGINVNDLPRGVLVGTVQIIGCRDLAMSDSEAACIQVDAGSGYYAWVLDRPMRAEVLVKPTRQPQPMFFKPVLRKGTLLTPAPSASSELRKTLEDSLLVRHISTRMETCGGDQLAIEVRAYMQERKFDVMGLLDGGRISRYISRTGLPGGTCADHGKRIEPTEIVSSTTALIDLLPIMKDRDHLFVLEGARLDSIVTSADLQKPPVRMLLFGLVSLVDMFLLSLVRRHCPEERFSDLLKPKRLEDARKLYDVRSARNEEIDLADCLQICDKRDLLLKSLGYGALGFETKNGAEKLLKGAEHLRNNLAHSQDLVLGSSWSNVIGLALGIDEFLRRCENLTLSIGTASPSLR